MTKPFEQTFAVTGTRHGSIVYAVTEGDARRALHKRYNGESIITVTKRKTTLID